MRGKGYMVYVVVLATVGLLMNCGPSLHSSNRWDRYQAVKQGSWTQDELFKVATEDTEEFVRSAAADKLTDETLLTKLATQSTSADVRKVATVKLSDQTLLTKIAREDKDASVRLAAVKSLNIQDALASLALDDPQQSVQVSAAEKLSNQNLLSRVANESKSPQVRITAIQGLSEQAILEKIATEDKDKSVRAAAINRISKLMGNNQESISNIAKDEANSKFIRIVAIFKIYDKSLLSELADHGKDNSIREAASMKLENLKTEDADKLIASCKSGKSAEIETLLQNVDVNVKDKDGFTALMSAAQWGRLEVVTMLLSKGADANAQNIYGRKAIDIVPTVNEGGCAAYDRRRILEMQKIGISVNVMASGVNCIDVWNLQDKFDEIIYVLRNAESKQTKKAK